jgi:hypothetical protein
LFGQVAFDKLRKPLRQSQDSPVKQILVYILEAIVSEAQVVAAATFDPKKVKLPELNKSFACQLQSAFSR